MILLLTIYIVTAAILISGTWFLKGPLKKIALSLTIGLVILPLSFVLFVGVFKSAIQQGKLLPGFGPILIFIAPPEDLRIPLGVQSLDPSKKEYHFEFQHKYVGNHVVDLSFKKLDSMEMAQNNLEIQYTVSVGGRNTFTQSSNKGWSYWGAKNSGLTFISYNVPQALPLREKLTATVTVRGDIKAFIDKYGPTQLVIQKGSDE